MTEPTNLRELAAWRTRCYIQQLREHADAEARAVEVEAERDAMERAIRGHGGSVLRGEFVLRGGKTSPIYVEWPS